MALRKWAGLLLALGVALRAAAVEARIFRWVDEKGVEHFTNEERNIPAAYRDKVKVTEFSAKARRSSSERTVIHFQRKGKAILLNGVLNYKLPVVFQLDTGATETLITVEDAEKLGLETGDAPMVRTRLADGRQVQFPRVRLNSLQVGKAEVRDLDVLVGRTRLLGLSFLNEFKMTMDSEHGQLVLEAPTHQRELESPEITREKERLIAEYQAKQDKLRLSMEQARKNIAFLESEIESLQNRYEQLSAKIEQAYRQNREIINIPELEASLQRLQLAVQSRRLQIENYRKDIEILENNINYYQDWIEKFQ